MGQSCRANDVDIRRKQTPSLPSHESIVTRNASKTKGYGKLSFHFCADGDMIETVFRTIISVNQLSIYGAGSDVCEEYGTCQTSTERPVVAEQSDPLFAPTNLLTKTPKPSIEIPAQAFLLQTYKERVRKLPQPNRLSKICAGCKIPENR